MIDLTGQVFGRLTVVSLSGKRGSGGNRFWLCHCQCGNETLVTGSDLRRTTGNTRSCGCLQRERSAAANTIHGHSGRGSSSPTYYSWQRMKARCYNPNEPNFSNYGGRGITVCDRWRFGEDGRSGFECFLADMGEKPPGIVLDRIDNDGNYSPANARWATHEQSANNRRPRSK
jgi:hypothetical protein